METIRIKDKLGRVIWITLWCLWQAILLLLAVGAVLEHEGHERLLVLLLNSTVSTGFIWIVLSSIPAVTLTPNGVYVRLWFRKRFYPWSQIQQACVLDCVSGLNHYIQIVLLKSGGSPLNPEKRKFFLVKNIGKTIPVTYSPEAKSYIIAHYGELAFDYTDGENRIAG